MIKVTADIQKKLQNMPESGMGFQIVEATFSNWIKRECIVLNATIAEPTYSRSVQSIFKSLAYEDVERMYKSASVSSEIIDVQMKTDKGMFKSVSFRKLAESGADKAPEEQTRAGEKFVRFSHFEDDKRIDSINKCVLPGTYATTLVDAEFCIRNGINPIARYALPNAHKPWL